MSLFSRLIDSPGNSRVKSILIVEDDVLIAFDNEHALVQAGYHVAATVDRYALAVQIMTDSVIDLVIADIALAGKHDGLDLARHARSFGAPTLFLSADCPPEAETLGFGWLAKPYMPRDLVLAVGVIETLLRGGKPRTLPHGLKLF